MADPHDHYYDNPDDYAWLMEQILLHETVQAADLGRELARRKRPRYVIDFGCGPGIYLLPFRHSGAQIFGVDACAAGGELLAPDEFQLVDLRKFWRHERVALVVPGPLGPPLPSWRFDLALCIEVAEHLRESDADVLVETITANSRSCFFSAAYQMPDGSPQGGEGHFNLKPQSWWREKFVKQGWDLDPVNADLQNYLQVREAYEHCGWLRWNGMLLSETRRS